MSTKTAPSTKDKGKARVTRQQSTAAKVEAAGQASHSKHQKTSAVVDTTLEEGVEEEEDDEDTEEDDKPSTRVAPTSNYENPDNQLIEAMRANLEALSNILAELR